MSTTLITHSGDLRRLRNEGYEVGVQANLLVLRNIPYVDGEGRVERGTLVSQLAVNGDITTKPDDHVVYFDGDLPHDEEGNPVWKEGYSPHLQDFGDGLAVKWMFSRKPPNGYVDYYDKMTRYVRVISQPAAILDPSATPKTFAVIEAESADSPFKYLDTASSRAEIRVATEKLMIGPVAIVGLGGTGSYILDLVAKTPVQEIHLFDDDKFMQHNAFRAPGAPSIETLRNAPTKAEYFRDLYLPMRNHIHAHGAIDGSTVDSLKDMDFVFIAANASARQLIGDELAESDVPFIDVGMGLEQVESSIHGLLRTTRSTASTRDLARQRLPVSTPKVDDIYATNIQVADLNALNASLAVIKWKKFCGFYSDFQRDYSSVYQVNGNVLTNRTVPDSE